MTTLRAYCGILAGALAAACMASGSVSHAGDKAAGGSTSPATPTPPTAAPTASSTSPAQTEAEIRKRVEAIRRQTQDLQARASRIERELLELPPRHFETRRELRAELRQVQEQFLALTAQLPDPANREKLIRRLSELKEDIHKLREGGHEREADQLQRDAIQIMQALVGLYDRSRAAAPKGGDGPEQRLSHLRKAIAELDAAGLYDQSQRLREELRRLQREAHGAETNSPQPQKDQHAPSRAAADK